MMSSFWNLSTGEDLSSTASGEFDAGGGRMELIPHDTSVLAMIDEAKWDRTQNNERFISLRWTILAPEEFKNRKIYQKLWLADAKPGVKPEKVEATRDKAKRMFAAIDFNAGNKHVEKRIDPTDESMTMYLTNKPMVLKILVWEIPDRMTGDMARGNWIGAVSPKTSPQSSSEDIAKAQAKQAQQKAQSAPSRNAALDDEIPF